MENEPLGTMPVKDAYWVIWNKEGILIDGNGFVIPIPAEKDVTIHMETSSFRE